MHLKQIGEMQLHGIPSCGQPKFQSTSTLRNMPKKKMCFPFFFLQVQIFETMV